MFAAAVLVLSLAAWIGGHWRRTLVGWAGWRDREAGIWHAFGIDSNQSVLSFYYLRCRSPVLVLDPRSIGSDTVEPVARGRSQLVWVCRAWGPSTNRIGIKRIPRSQIPIDGFFIGVPSWCLAILSALVVLPPVLRTSWQRRRIRNRRCLGLCLQCGSRCVGFFHIYYLPVPRPWPETRPAIPGAFEASSRMCAFWEHAGFTYYHIESAPKARMPIDKVARLLFVPFWAILVFTLLLPAARIPALIARRRRARRLARGLCLRCPECGTVVLAEHVDNDNGSAHNPA